MRALVLHDPDRPPRLAEVDPIPDGAGNVVDVVAAGLNPVDLKQAGSTRPEHLPRVVGNEAVVRINGRLGYAERTIDPAGSIAERTVVDPDTVVPLPDGVAPSAAVALGIPGVAAWLALTEVGRLAKGETVVVLGATGAAGRIAVQAAKLLGAGWVVAAGRRAEALRPLTDLGADAVAVLDNQDGKDDTAALWEAAGGEVDLVFDPLFGPPLVAALATLRTGGRSVTIGMSAGATAEIPFTTLLGRAMLSHANLTAPVELKALAYRELVGHLAAGRLSTDTEDVPLADAERAWERQRQGPGRKLVIVP